MSNGNRFICRENVYSAVGSIAAKLKVLSVMLVTFLTYSLSAHAVDVTVPPSISATSSGGVCTITGSYTITGVDTDGRTNGQDRYRTRITRNGTTGGTPSIGAPNGNATVTKGTTEQASAMYDLSVASVGSAMSLFFNVTERDNHTGGASDGDVVSSTEITPAILRAAGGECEAIANSIDPVNTAPTADAGPDQNITSDAGLIVTLNGAASSDPQGDTLNYTWTQTGGTTVTLSDANIAMPTFPTPNADTTLVFSLIVNDGSLDSAPSTTTVNFTFVAGNSAPTADAGADQTITAAGGATITLDGSASSDLDGDPLTYMWTQTSGTAVALSDATAVMPTFSAPNADATLVFSLVVNDGTVDSAPATATVTYTFSATNTAPEANAGPNQDITAAAGTTITLDGSGSTDIDGDTLTYMWVQAGTPSVTLTGADTVSPTFPAPAADETLFFDLIVNDGTVDSVADRMRVRFTVVASNTAPVADAGADQAITAVAGTSITLDGSASADADSDPLTYMWTQTSGTAVTLSDATAVSPTFAAPGADATLVFSLVVNDGTVDSAPATTTVTYTFVAGNAIPVANAGADQAITALAGTTITLDGSASMDADSDPLTYMWTQTSGTAVTLSDATAVMPTFSAPNADATLVFSLVVNDGTADSAADATTVTYTFQAANTAPVANAGPNQDITAAAGTTITLDGSGSMDADSDPLTYMWVQTGTPTITLTGADTVAPTFSAPAADEIFFFDLIVNDGTVDSVSDRVRIAFTAVATNTAPVADAGADQAITAVAGTSITLDGSASMDADSDPLTYMWTQTSGTAVTLSDATAVSPTFAAPGADATLVFSLVVNDSTVDSAPATTTVTYTFMAGNAIPVANAGADQAITALAGTTITLNGTGSNDANGDPLTYAWTQTSGTLVTLSNASAVSPTFTSPGADATLVFSLVVNDGTVDSAPDMTTVTFTFVAPNVAPVASAGADQNITAVAGTAIALDGSGSNDGNGDALTYIWTQTSGAAVTLSNANAASPTFTSPNADTILVFSLVVNDGTVNSAADTTTVTYNFVAANDAPVADAGADQSVMALAGTTITLDGSGSSDADNNPLTYAWTQTSGAAVTLSDAAAVSPTFSAPNADETLMFSLVVNDGTVNSAADTTTVTYNFVAPNVAPTANAGADQSLTGVEGETVTLNGSGSNDANGDALTYAWIQTGGTAVTLSNASAVSPSFTVPEVAGTTDFVFELTVNDGAIQSTDTVTVTVEPTGSITLVVQATGEDRGFRFNSNLNALDAEVQTMGGTGQLVANDVVSGTYTARFADVSQLGFALTGISCDSGSAAANTSTRTATIALAPGDNVTCTFSTVNSRAEAQKAIGTMVASRNTVLLANQPQFGRRMDRLNGRRSGNGGLSAGGFTLPGSEKLPIQVAMSNGSAAVKTSLSSILNTGDKRPKYDIWIEGITSKFNVQNTEGDYNILYAGVDVLAGENTLFGIVGQYDVFDSDRSDDTFLSSGKGFMVGPYTTVKLSESLYFDGRLGLGQSDNEVSPLGTYRDKFDTNRYLATGSITGDYQFKNGISIQPTLGVRHITEQQKEYVDSLGVIIPGQTIDLSTINLAPRISKEFRVNKDLIVSTFMTAEGIYSFGKAQKFVSNDNIRGRLEGGLSFNTSNGLIYNLSAFSDGIGASGFSSEGLRFSIGYTPR